MESDINYNLKSPSVSLASRCLLLHGMAQTDVEILPIKNALEKYSIDCFLPKLPAHRLTLPSEREVSPHNWRLEIDTYFKFISMDFSEPIILCGHSFGALLALDLATRYPTLIKGIILFSPSFILKNKAFNILVSILKFIPNIIIRKLPNIPKSRVAKKHLASNDHYSLNMLRNLSLLRAEVAKNICKLELPIYIIQSSKDYHLNPLSPYKLKALAQRSKVKVALRNFGDVHNLAKTDYIEELVKEGLNYININLDASKSPV